jgi:hypothetical protein
MLTCAVHEARQESLIIEGVHLHISYVVKLMGRHPSLVPFLLYIKSPTKHTERMAVRAKYMTLVGGRLQDTVVFQAAEVDKHADVIMPQAPALGICQRNRRCWDWPGRGTCFAHGAQAPTQVTCGTLLTEIFCSLLHLAAFAGPRQEQVCGPHAEHPLDPGLPGAQGACGCSGLEGLYVSCCARPYFDMPNLVHTRSACIRQWPTHIW